MVLEEFGVVLVFLALGAAFVYGNLLLGRLIRPSAPGSGKEAIYECGEPTIGLSWIRFNTRFYTIALVYLLFDVEVVVLLPTALVLKSLAGVGYGATALAGVLLFVGVLTLGLVYEWFWGNLDWVRGELEPGAEPADKDIGATTRIRPALARPRLRAR